MYRLTCILLALLLATQAKVAPSHIAREEDPPSCVDYRSLSNIVWGCVSTTIICASAAIHPNIPPREGPFKGALRRLELMFWTVVAPEILPCWALNQLLAALTVRDVYNKAKGYEKERCGIWKTVKGWFSLYEIKEAASPFWTVTHGHFLIMGGFHVVEPPEDGDGSTESTGASMGRRRALDVSPTSAVLVEETNMDTEKGHGPSQKRPEPKLERDRVTILTLQMLRELVKDPEFEIQITEEEITHRSKGDALSKIIFILQSTWFILQCLGRRVQGQDLTQLELTTLALASLNAITFGLWWNKPLGAQALVRVYLKRELTDSERQAWRAKIDLSSRFPMIIWYCVITIRDAFLCQSEGNTFVTWLIRLPVAILLLLLSPIIGLPLVFSTNLFGLLGGSSSFPPDDTHVPTFYVPYHRYSQWYHIFLLITLGATFGGIHCSGWNFFFPTYAEQKLWQVASLAVTIIPIVTFPLSLIINSIVTRRPPTFEPRFGENDHPGIWTFFACTLAYVFARLVLLVLALELLRHPPPTAFITTDWTKFYPHFL